MTKPIVNHTLYEKILKTADKLIALSNQYADKMEAWPDESDVFVGFITKESNEPGVDFVIDIQAAPDSEKALLRTWAIECVADDEGNERFNNLQIGFAVDRATAQDLIKQENSISREDIASFLHVSPILIDSIVVSNQTGKNKVSQQLLGKRYDFDYEKILKLSDDAASELCVAIEKVLQKLTESVNSYLRS